MEYALGLTAQLHQMSAVEDRITPLVYIVLNRENRKNYICFTNIV